MLSGTGTKKPRKAFEILKEKLSTEPVLALPTDDGEYVLDTDASEVGISGILQQYQWVNGKQKLRVLHYGSRGLRGPERNYGAPKLEMLAALTFIEKFSAHLIHRKFTLRCDNQALSWLKTYRLKSALVSRWVTRLDAYNFDFVHRDRNKHQNADGLSKQTNFYLQAEQNPEKVRGGFNFMSERAYEAIPILNEDKGDTRLADETKEPVAFGTDSAGTNPFSDPDLREDEPASVAQIQTTSRTTNSTKETDPVCSKTTHPDQKLSGEITDQEGLVTEGEV